MTPLTINPLLIIGVSALLYTGIVVLRRQTLYLLLLALTLLNFGLIFLASGQNTIKVLQKQPQTIERIECLGQSIANGAPLVAKASLGISSCHFNGTGIGASDADKITNLLTSPGS